MRYLVTGGAGFIGSHLVERLLTDGHQVVVLDDFSTGRRENLEPFAKDIRLIEGTVTDSGTCAKAVDGVDFVLHQAALGSVPRSLADPARTHDVNATGTLRLLDAARRMTVRRFVYAGSSSAYGNTAELPKHEGMTCRPLSPYAVAKLCGEQYLAAFYASYGFETVTLRYFNVFGPRQEPTSQYAAAIPKFVTAALDDESPTIFGDGEQTRDFTYVSNVVDANLLACEAPTQLVAGQVFNIGAGGRTSINELWKRIASLTGTKSRPTYGPERKGDVRDSLASLERSSAALTYVPRVSVAEGLAKTVDSFVALRALGRA
jgi:nucleoside-diphosphate-sugar epimerase